MAEARYLKLAEHIENELNNSEECFLDISKGTEAKYAVSKETFRRAIVELEKKGHCVMYVKIAPDTVRKILSTKKLEPGQIIKAITGRKN